MKRKRIHIPKEGLPAWALADEADTIGCARARVALYILVGVVYAGLIIASCFGLVNLTYANSVILGYFVVFGVPTIYYGVRPGKAKAWWVSLAIVLVSLLYLPLIMIVPLCVVGAHLVRYRR